MQIQPPSGPIIPPSAPSNYGPVQQVNDDLDSMSKCITGYTEGILSWDQLTDNLSSLSQRIQMTFDNYPNAFSAEQKGAIEKVMSRAPQLVPNDMAALLAYQNELDAAKIPT